MDVENGKLSCAVQSTLNCDRGGSAACAAEGDLLAGDIHALVAEHVDIAFAVRDVTGENAVVIYDRVACADDLCGVRVLVRVLKCRGLAGHCDVEAADPQCAHRVESGGNLIFLNGESNICIVEAEKFAGIIMHFR